jgi:hypothetical protein
MDAKAIQFFFPNSIIRPLPNTDATRVFLRDAVYPTLSDALTVLCKEKPANPTVGSY